MFDSAVKVIKEQDKNILVHLSASGGYLKGLYYDMVRIGLLLYGYSPYKTNKILVKPVMQVNSVVLKTRTLKKGQTALYGDKKVKKDQEVAIVSYGYADGLQRKQVKGIFNNRCMNLTAVNCKTPKGKRVSVMQNAQDIAQKYKTISYEVLVK